jgi:hypothetical protein
MDVRKEKLQGTADKLKASESGNSYEKEDAKRIFCQENFSHFGGGDIRDLCESYSKWAHVER